MTKHDAIAYYHPYVCLFYKTPQKRRKIHLGATKASCRLLKSSYFLRLCHTKLELWLHQIFLRNTKRLSTAGMHLSPELLASNVMCVVWSSRSSYTIVKCIELSPIAVVLDADYFDLLLSKIAHNVDRIEWLMKLLRWETSLIGANSKDRKFTKGNYLPSDFFIIIRGKFKALLWEDSVHKGRLGNYVAMKLWCT